MSVDPSQSAKHSSASTEHFTPPKITTAAHRVMGDIDLDPASSELANKELVVARKFYDAAANGFAKEWHGRVFLNPPGGKCDESGVSLFKREGEKGFFYADGSRCTKPARSSVTSWWNRLVTEWKLGRTTQAIFIGFSIEILQASQVDSPMSCMDFSICVPGRRLAFWSVVDGKFGPGTSPTHANVIVYIPPNDDTRAAIDNFCIQFKDVGACKR